MHDAARRDRVARAPSLRRRVLLRGAGRTGRLRLRQCVAPSSLVLRRRLTGWARPVVAVVTTERERRMRNDAVVVEEGSDEPTKQAIKRCCSPASRSMFAADPDESLPLELRDREQTARGWGQAMFSRVAPPDLEEDDADLRRRASFLLACAVVMIVLQCSAIVGVESSGSPSCTPASMIDYRCQSTAAVMTSSDWVAMVLAGLVLAVTVAEETRGGPDTSALSSAVPPDRNQLAG